MFLKEGMEVPADGLFFKGYNMKVDESSMTGESKYMSKELLEKCH